LKITDIQHLLEEGYQVEIVASKMDDGRIRVIYLPKITGDKLKLGDADKSVLQNPFILKGTAEELDKESPAKIKEWTSKLKEGKDNLEQIQAELDKAAKAKKASAKKATPAKKPAVKKKTAAEKKEEARKAQAAEQGDLFSDNTSRLDDNKDAMADEIAELGI